MSNTFRFTMLPALVLMSVFGLAACDDDDDGNGNGVDAGVDAGADAGDQDGGAETAELRVIHLSPDAPAVDVWIEGEDAPVVEGLAFEETTGYLDLDPGTYTFQVTAAGDTPGDGVVLAIEDVEVVAGQAYTAAAYGEATAEPATLAALLLEDDLSEVAAGTARVRPVHTAAGLGPVDVTITNGDGTVTETIEQLGFGEAADAIELPVDTYTADIDADGDGTPEVSFADIETIDGAIVNAYAVVGDAGPFLLAQFSDGTTQRYAPGGQDGQVDVRAIHLAADAPPVDIYGATDPPTPGFQNLAFGESTAYLTVPLGLGFLVVPNGADATDPANVVLQLGAEELDLTAGGTYTAAVFGEVAAAPTDPTALSALLLTDDPTPPAAGSGRVTPAHTAVGLADVAVDVYEVSAPDTPIVTGLAYGHAGEALELPAGSYSLGFDADGDTSSFEAVYDVELLEGQILNGFAATDDTGSTNLYLQDATGAVQAVAPTTP